MKYLLSLLLAFNIAAASAQVVNIPDPAFKSYLVNNTFINTNGDTEIQESEALNVTTISISTNLGITDITGIGSFINLKTLSIFYNQINTIDLSQLNQLSNLGCSENGLTSLNLDGCTSLKNLSCDHNQLASLDLSDCDSLKNLYCTDNLLTSIDLDGLDSLESLYLDRNKLTNLNISGLPKLQMVFLGENELLKEVIGDFAPNLGYLSLYRCKLNKVSLQNCPNLVTPLLMGCNIDTLDISNSPGVTELENFDTIRNLIAVNCTGLTIISFGRCVTESLVVTGCTGLNIISLYLLDTKSIDLSTCINFSQLELSNIGPNCEFINIKNGSFTNIQFLVQLQSSNLNICVDDFELETLVNIFANYNSTNPVNISSTCSFFPGGNYNTIKGKVRIDVNNNGCETTDPGMANVPIRITDADGNTTVRYSVFSGAYAHYTGAGNFTLNPYFAYPYFNIAPLTAAVSFDTANNLIDSVDFCITPNGTHNDLEVSILPIIPARPGFQASYKVVYKNKGTTTQSGNVQLNFDNSKMSFDAATPTVSSQSAGQLVWNYSNLLPFESRSVDVNFTLLPPPVNNVGDTIYFMAAINPVVNDETAYDNSFVLPQVIRGSFDPNDKECLQGSKLSIASLDKYLHYMIRFQNLGTDTAFNVVVNDALSDKFDWNTVEIVSASHTCDVKQIKNKLEFYFRDIKLPYATINEPASHGFVAFKVKPKAGAVIGDSLNNKAAIYFDFNLPVITNTASTVVSPASSVPVKLEYFSLSSKPSGNLLTWKASSTNGITKFGIEKSNDGIHFSNMGNITATTDRCQLPFNFTDDKPFDGKTFYRLNITDADGLSFYSKVLVAGKNKSGLQITAVVSDRNNTIAYLNASKQQNIQMKIIAADGKLVHYQNKTITAGNNILNLQLKNFASGIYTLIVYTSEGETLTKRFIK